MKRFTSAQIHTFNIILIIFQYVFTVQVTFLNDFKHFEKYMMGN